MSKAALLAELRSRIRRIEGLGSEGGGRVLPLGAAGVDGMLPDGGLPLGCVHELVAVDPGAGTAFAAALLARLAAAGNGPVLWIVRGRDLHAPGLAAYGLTPDRLIAVRAVRDTDALWAMEEALRCRALAGVLGEVGGIDLTAGRRLQLAAEAGGVTGLLLHPETRVKEAGSAAVTRWRLASAPGVPEQDEPGVGEPRWRVELLRCRGGRPGVRVLGWRDGAFLEADDALGVEDAHWPWTGRRANG